MVGGLNYWCVAGGANRLLLCRLVRRYLGWVALI